MSEKKRGGFKPGVSGNPDKMFKPGISPNPKGRPKGAGVSKLILQRLDEILDVKPVKIKNDTNLDALFFIDGEYYRRDQLHLLNHRNKTYREALRDVLIDRALRGEDWAFKHIFERTEGKVVDTIKHEGDGLTPSVIILPSNGRD